MIHAVKIPNTFSLSDRYLLEDGSIYLSGTQALVRLLLDQKRLDRRNGLSTAGFVCGYPGSPVGGVDQELDRHQAILDSHDIVHKQGLNEELAATAAFGTQLLHTVPGARYDGVFSLWFGKAPGVDRASDAFHHGNFRGVGRNGGVLAVAGDDPQARSTICPSDSNLAFYKAFMPILAPGNIQEILDFGLHGYALSRACGLWVGLKLVTDLADSAASAQVAPDRISPIIPSVELDGAPFVPTARPNEAGAALIEAERRILKVQLEIARDYARLNNLNRITVNPGQARVGILTSGKTYFDVRQSLHDLGLDDETLHALGIRVLKMGMLFPFEPAIVSTFAQGLEEIIVIEDKRPFLELFLKEHLYSAIDRPRIVGKTDEHGEPLLPGYGELNADLITMALEKRLTRCLDRPITKTRSHQVQAQRPAPSPLTAPRTPYFCSGCPHNRSLHVPEGSIVGGGIGCHIMGIGMSSVFGGITGFTQMGGEGAQWAGLAPFTSSNHFFQNLGDGTFAHSGSLGLRFVAASGANVTYKILYNSTVAMTGGQDVLGGMSVSQMVKMLEAEGAEKIIVTTDEPERYASNVHSAKVMHRDDLLDAERELAATPGLTVLIHDQECATQKRRLRRRGKMPYRSKTIVINERVCEGCGDCGKKSNCLSVQPVDTEFGRKTRIHQSSCNQDFSCLLGDCPSFVTIESNQQAVTPIKRKQVRFPEDVTLPAPHLHFGKSISIGLIGIGGTGVVTVNQILGTAAFLSGMQVQTYDHTGASQKAGPVVSHFKTSLPGQERSPTLSAGEANLLLVFDPLAAMSPVNLRLASSDRTIAIVSTSKVSTGAMVSNRTIAYPKLGFVTDTIDSVTKAKHNVYFEAQELAESLLGDHLASNMLLVGIAFQMGVLPIPLEAIEEAIRLNGTAVDMNLLAFQWGRLTVAHPDRIPQPREADETQASDSLNPAVDPRAVHMIESLRLAGDNKQRLERLASELIAYQSLAYAGEYVEFMRKTYAAEAAAGCPDRAFSTAVAESLFKLMTYKDEYEVARLLLLDSECQKIDAAFGPSAKVTWHLRPTFLRRIGVAGKVSLGAWFTPVLQALRAMRRIRGSRLDLFGRSHVKASERLLIGHYRTIVESAFDMLAENHTTAIELARAPDLVRGYGDIKIESIGKFYQEVERLRLVSQNAPTQVAA